MNRRPIRMGELVGSPIEDEGLPERILPDYGDFAFDGDAPRHMPIDDVAAKEAEQITPQDAQRSVVAPHAGAISIVSLFEM